MNTEYKKQFLLIFTSANAVYIIYTNYEFASLLYQSKKSTKSNIKLNILRENRIFETELTFPFKYKNLRQQRINRQKSAKGKLYIIYNKV